MSTERDLLEGPLNEEQQKYLDSLEGPLDAQQLHNLAMLGWDLDKLEWPSKEELDALLDKKDSSSEEPSHPAEAELIERVKSRIHGLSEDDLLPHLQAAGLVALE